MIPSFRWVAALVLGLMMLPALGAQVPQADSRQRIEAAGLALALPEGWQLVPYQAGTRSAWKLKSKDASVEIDIILWSQKGISLESLLIETQKELGFQVLETLDQTEGENEDAEPGSETDEFADEDADSLDMLRYKIKTAGTQPRNGRLMLVAPDDKLRVLVLALSPTTETPQQALVLETILLSLKSLDSEDEGGEEEPDDDLSLDMEE